MLLKIILPILIVAAIVGGFFYFSANKQQSAPKTQNTTPASSSPQTENTSPSSQSTYTNTKYSFSLNYPQSWKVVESESKDGANFQLNGETVARVSVGGKTLDGYSMSLDQYVKIAASQEIQNYKKQASQTVITTKSGITGYITTWDVQAMIGTGGGLGVSMPITYFPLQNNNKKTIQITLENEAVKQDYQYVLSTFTYTQ